MFTALYIDCTESAPESAIEVSGDRVVGVSTVNK